MIKLTYPSQLVLFLILCIFSDFTQAQTISLGTTDTEFSTITTSSPVNIWFRKTACQMVYTAAELSAEGAVASEISELGFFITNNPLFSLPNYQIQIKHTSATDASGDLEGGYTTVKSIVDYVPDAGGWDMHILDTPFAWDGVQNIVVRVCWSRVDPTYDPSGQVRVYEATNGYKYFRSDAAGTACGDVPNITLNTKPQIRLKFQSETVWTGAVSSAWNNAANWTAAVPSETINATIPAGTPNDPIINGAANCMNLTLVGELTLSSTGVIEIKEDFSNTGVFNDLGGVVSFDGVEPQLLNTTGTITIENLQCNSNAGLTIASGTVVVGTELQVNKGIFNTGDQVILRSDAGGTARVDELSTTCTYTLVMTDTWGDGWNGGFITIFSEGEEIGMFSGGGSSSTETFKIVNDNDFTINYTAGDYENENAYELLDDGGGVLFSDGTTPATGDVYTGTAGGCSFTSTIEGNITMERYIDEGETYWRYFASAIENPAISQYLDDFTTAGFPGTPFPDFPFTSIYYYDETLPPFAGYVACPSTDQIIGVGQGFQVWSGDTITGTDPFVVDLYGPLNQGDIDLPVTYTPSGEATQDGWCLVGNPYASTIDWRDLTWTKTNMADATYIQDPDTQNYATYISGASANGGSQFIASQQSFWVHAIGPSPVLTARETVKSSVDAEFFKAGEIYNQGMTIKIIGEGISDEAVLRHIIGASDEVEPALDAVKLFGGWGVNPQLTLLNTTGEELTVHSFDKGTSEHVIPLKTVVFESGTYNLNFFNVFELGSACVKLEDSYTGMFYDIEEEVELVFTLSDTMTSPRFFIHLGREFEYVKSNISCNGFADGDYAIEIGTETTYDYELIADGYYEAGTTSSEVVSFADLAPNSYTLYLLDFDNLCEESAFNFMISEPELLSLSATTSGEISGMDGSIAVEIDGGTSPYTYVWSNGETTPAINDLAGGEYSLTVVDGNTCVLDSTFYIKSDLSDLDEATNTVVKVRYNALNNQLIIEGNSDVVAQTVNLYSSSGQILATYVVQQTDATIQLPSNLAKGIYLVQSPNWVYRFSY